MRTFSFMLIAAGLTLTACRSSSSDQESVSDPMPMLGILDMNDSIKLPFRFRWDADQQLMIIQNAEEEIRVDSIYSIGDTTTLVLPVFQSELHVLISDSTWSGYWTKTDAENYWMPFSAKQQQDGYTDRFPWIQEDGSSSIPYRWEVEFRTGTDNPKTAIGEFEVDAQGVITGSFITETGDYRFLEGEFDGRNFVVSTFDGMHAYLFKAIYDGTELRGMHYSGLTYAQPWKAFPNDAIELRDPTELTFLKEGYETISFEVDGLDGNTYSFNGNQVEGPTIIQIMGSWCPNCMDETRYFNSLHYKYADQGLNIIGITYEVRGELSAALPAIQKMKKDLDIPYTIVFGGQARSESIEKTLPMIDNFMSYPTSIFLDKDGNVRRIHTGFSGPGTSAYEQYTIETEDLIQTMLAE